MKENPFSSYFSADLDHLLPVLDAGRLKKISLDILSRQIPGVIPRLYYDLEHLQVGRYEDFQGVNSEQLELIRKLHSESPIRADEMLYLALRSMFCFVWPKPGSEDDILRAIANEYVLSDVLTSTALDESKKLQKSDATLPYWGRLSFLRVMAAIPAESVYENKLDSITCTLVKRNVFNATCYSLKNSSVIGYNYALEPILKHLNRYLLHFFHTQDMAGETRLARAWSVILPTVLFFWADAPANKVAKHALLYDEEVVKRAQELTAFQLDFITAHEIGHVIHDHPRRAVEFTNKAQTSQTSRDLRHEFEYVADDFAFGIMRSSLLNDLRYNLNPKNAEKVEADASIAAVYEYQSKYESVRLLFAYMSFIERAGAQLKAKLSDSFKFRKSIDSHPSASTRLHRLHTANLGDIPHSTELIRYCEALFDRVLEYAAALGVDDMKSSLSGPVVSRRGATGVRGG